MKNELAGWLNSEGENLLRSVGVRGGQVVLDFGCGSGNYAIPAAKIVGEKGRVYAVDKKSKGIWASEGLLELTKRARSRGLSNIEAVKTSGELEVGLEDESVDFVLLYDVLHHYYFPDGSERKSLLSELHRVLKPGGILSFYPGDPTEYRIKDTVIAMRRTDAASIMVEELSHSEPVRNLQPLSGDGIE